MAYSCCVVYLLCLCSLLIINGVASDEDDFSVKNCYKKAAPGPCMAYMPRWYYNSTLNNCTTFIYGGCQGNKNRFESREECEEKCLNVVSQQGESSTDNNHQSSHGENPTPEGPCITAKKEAEIRKRLFAAIHFFGGPRHIPDCDVNGYYKPMQCKNHRINISCWCVDPWGNKIKSSDGRHKRRKPDELDCS